jgi:DNA processing protein
MGNKLLGDKKYWIWLSGIEGIGSVRFMKLIEYFGSAKSVFLSSREELINSRILGEKLVNRVVMSRNEDNINNYLKLVKENDVKVYTIFENEYPENLKQIHDPPPVLYVKGELREEDNCAIAMVGSRKASEYGIRVAERIAERLVGLGITIISGLAMGIDSASHRGAVKGGGRTIAVMGCGLKHIYPKSNTGLGIEIAKNGALISDYPIEEEARPEYFPARNRIISGMSLGVIVVEAGEKSGSLITVDFALEQGREVFAVPGNITSPNSRGANMLIKSGAKLISRIEDILEEFNIDIIYRGNSDDKEEAKDMSKEERTILKFLKKSGCDMDSLITATGIKSAKVISIVSMLEIKGLIRQIGGIYYLN